MILGVDIGGTKTLIGLFDDQGVLVLEDRFQTTRDKSTFEENLRASLLRTTRGKSINAIGIASPGQIEDGVIIWAGPNLGWENFTLSQIVNEIVDAPIFIDNDANLAALAEARALSEDNPLVLYVTLSTGVGSGVVIDGSLMPALSGSEAGQMLIFTKQGRLVKWEDIASGKSLTEKTGLRAEDIDDNDIWRQYAEDVCLGLQPTINVLRPQKVILGGGVGMYADKYRGHLTEILNQQIKSTSYNTPEILPAHYGEKSVIYGCYEYAKDHLQTYH